MKYSEVDVIDLLKYAEVKNPKKIFNNWLNDTISDKLVDDNFIYTDAATEPLIFNGEEIGKFHIFSISDRNIAFHDLVKMKYFGHPYSETVFTLFSHDSYLDIFLEIYDKKLLKVPSSDFCDSFYFVEGTFNNGENKFTLSYGNIELDDDYYGEKYEYHYKKYVKPYPNNYYDYDSGIFSLSVEKSEFSDIEPAVKKINRRIKERTLLK